MTFDWKSLVRVVAPTIASLFGTPLAGMAVKAVADAVLGPEEARENQEQKLEAALATASPEMLQKIKQADQEFKLSMEKLGVDLEKIAAEDRASARQREMATKDWTPKVLAFVVSLGFFGVLAWMLRFEIPAAGRDALLVMLGSLGTAWAAIIAYYFGSSAGSARKTELLSK